MSGECEEEAFDFGGDGVTGEPADGLGEDSGINLLAVTRDHRVIEFVDQAHGEEGPGIYDSS
ncbi:hypothetical protein [Tunturiibacter gelidiferens]|uniref:hypothetical protein n=1 Tax=Tunturiibacter gelidiferens TaxID=3069689 RepID=UPI003D9B12F8